MGVFRDAKALNPVLPSPALTDAHPHGLIGVAGLPGPVLPLAAEKLLSQALSDDRVGI